MNSFQTLVALATIALSGSGSQADPADVLKIERTVAQYARTLYETGQLGFDEGTHPGRTPNPGSPPHRTTAHVADLVNDAGARKVKMEEVIVCFRPRDPMSCRMQGVNAVIRIGLPFIQGDSAIVWLYSYNDHPGGLTPVSASDEQLLVRREQNAWRVVRVLQYRKS